MSKFWKKYIDKPIELILDKEHPDESDDRRALIGVIKAVKPFSDIMEGGGYFRLVFQLENGIIRNIRCNNVFDFSLIVPEAGATQIE